MTTIHYKRPAQTRWGEERNRPDKATLWALILTVVASVIALTFGEAEGSIAVLTKLLSG